MHETTGKQVRIQGMEVLQADKVHKQEPQRIYKWLRFTQPSLHV